MNGYEDYYMKGVNKDIEGNDDDDWRRLSWWCSEQSDDLNVNDDLYKLIKFVDVLNLDLAKLVKMEIFKQVILKIKEELKELTSGGRVVMQLTSSSNLKPGCWSAGDWKFASC